MSLAVACPSCRRCLSFADAFAGRRGMCSACEATFTIGGPPAPPRKRRPQASDEEIALYLRGALELKALPADRAKRLEADFRAARERGDADSFIEYAAENSGIAPESHQRIVRAVNRALRRRRPAPPVDSRECPNCFERIAKKAASCRFCGVDFAAVEPMEVCANCGVVQPAENAFCRSCGANVATGLVGEVRVRKCPRCGLPSRGMESVCVVCRTPLSFPRPVVLAGLALRGAWRTLAGARGYAALAVLLVGAFVAYRERQTILGWLGIAAHGEEEAALRRAVAGLTEAIRFRDWAGAGRHVEPSLPAAQFQARLRAFLGVAPDDAGEWTLEEARVARATVEGEVATTYLELRLRRVPRAGEPAATPQELLEGLGGGSGGPSGTRTSQVTWSWTRTPSGWRVRAP